MVEQLSLMHGNIIYSKDTSGNPKTSYEYVLKPYSPYSARYVNENIDITVNYTLDNYIRVYGTIGSDYVTKEGYLVVPDDDNGVDKVTSGQITGITYRKADIGKEVLKENVYYIRDSDNKPEVEEYPYIYDQNDNKLYWDDTDTVQNYFTINKNNRREYLPDTLKEGDPNFAISNTFRKISVPVQNGSDWEIQKVYQLLNPKNPSTTGEDKKRPYYVEDASGVFRDYTSNKVGNMPIGGIMQYEDFSAINYCTESYVFTQWVNKKLGDITVDKMVNRPTDKEYNNVDSTTKIFEITSANNPDPENDSAYETSPLAQHKKDVIINTLENNLAQATAEAQEADVNYDYRLPRLSYEEWEQALSNISIIAFMQGIPTGLKYYNNYAIATSTLNKEYVDPDELYFCNNSADKYYHQRDCSKITGSAENYTGYRSIDYVTKSYGKGDDTQYYYLHNNGENASLACYHCLVNRATYNKSNTEQWTNQYYNALARERYMQLDQPGTYKPNATITKTVDKTTAEYSHSLIYTITIKNTGLAEDVVYLYDDLAGGKLQFEHIIENNSGATISEKTNTEGKKLLFGGPIILPADGTEITIKYSARLKPTVLGETVKNTATIYSSESQTYKYAEASSSTNAKKTIRIASSTGVTDKYNVILVLDNSWSLGVPLVPKVKESANEFVSDLQNTSEKRENIKIKYVKFAKGARTITSLEQYTPFTLSGGTDYMGALLRTKDCIDKNEKVKNIVVFMSDGSPTVSSTNIVFQTIKNIPFIGDALYTVGLGWLELVWKNENEYGFQLAFTGPITYPDWAEKIIKNTPFLQNKLILSAGNQWREIMDNVNKIKNGDKNEFYTIYFNHGHDSSPIYGLKQMATDEKHAFVAEDTNELSNYFKDLAKNIIPEGTKEEDKECNTNTIILDSGIKQIKINNTEIDFNTYVKDIGEGKCELDISNWLGDQIEIIY